MTFDSQYRRQAMEILQVSKSELKQDAYDSIDKGIRNVHSLHEMFINWFHHLSKQF